MTETPLLPAVFEAIELGSEPIATFKKIVFVDEPELGQKIAGLLRMNKAVILKRHGVVVGKSFEETSILALKLEVVAKLQLAANSVGKLAPSTDHKKRPLIKFLKLADLRGGIATAYGRSWAYYEFLLKND